jgi:hypothetical protein
MRSDLLPFLSFGKHGTENCHALGSLLTEQLASINFMAGFCHTGKWGQGNFTNRDCLLSSLLARLERKRVTSNCKVYLSFICPYLTNNAANLQMFQRDINLQLLNFACVCIFGCIESLCIVLKLFLYSNLLFGTL